MTGGADACLDSLFTQAPVGLALFDAQGRHLRVNSVLARMGGHTPGEYIGRTIPELLGDVGHELDRLLRRVLTTGEPVLDLEVDVPSGTTAAPQAWMVSLYSVIGCDGETPGVALVATDVTQTCEQLADSRRELVRSEARYRALAEVGTGDAFHANRHGTLDVDLPRWRAITGQRREEISGFGWLRAVHIDDRDRVAAAWREAVTQLTAFESEFRVAGTDGADRMLAMRVLPVIHDACVDAHPDADADADAVEWVGVTRDITEVRAAEKARHALSARARTGAERTERLCAVAADLSRAATIDEVIAVVLDAGQRTLDATVRGIALVDHDDDCLRLRSLVGDPGRSRPWSDVDLGAIPPVAETVRGGRPVFVTTGVEPTMRWPSQTPESQCLRTWNLAGCDEHAWAFLPLATTDAPFGVLLFGFGSPREFAAEDRTYLTALAEQCAQALERATLFERVVTQARLSRQAEETAREAEGSAREAGRRLELLARATAAVSGALDPQRALRALTDVAVGALADSCAVYLVESHDSRSGPGTGKGAGDPTGAPVLRRAVASVRSGLTRLPMPRAQVGRWPWDSPVNLAAVTGRGHIAPLDGASWLSSSDMARWMQHVGAHTLAAVPLILRGRVAGVVSLMAAGDRPPFTTADIVFLEELAARAAVAVEHAELYRRSRETALTLQRSLLPPAVVEPDGLEIAARYLPGVEDTEVGGDWFDVIDLGAGRVGLVIGDVMGRGVRAAAIMGQLRTAVRTCARLDLSPYEVLTLLDGVVCDIDEGQIATCIYGVIEPHTGLLTLASAGHPPPLVVAPDGLVSRLYMQVGTPLGLGRGDARQYTVRLQQGALLAMFTDGLVECRDRDIDAGMSDLASVLSRPYGSLCKRADEALVALVRDEARQDDVALLLVGLAGNDSSGAARSSEITVPQGSAGVGEARRGAHDLLNLWSVDAETADSVILLMSELVTNALVHGQSPISVRLRRTGTRVILEVADCDPRLPRRRHAEVDDEGGRGLELVSRIASRWGTRSSGEGKVVWAEIPAPASA